MATIRINRRTNRRVMDAILSGTHEPGTSHYELLGAFIDSETLRRITVELDAAGYRTHELGDSMLIVGQADSLPDNMHGRLSACPTT